MYYVHLNIPAVTMTDLKLIKFMKLEQFNGLPELQTIHSGLATVSVLEL